MTLNTATLATRLGQMDIFQSVPPDILLELAAKAEIVRVEAGQTVFHKNEPARSLFLLLEGSAKVHDNDYTVAQMGEGSCFGEMSLLDEGPRSMSVTATTPTLLAGVGREVFFEVLGDSPAVMQKIVSLLTRRLRSQTDQTVAQLQRREEELTRQVAERTAELMRQKEQAEIEKKEAERQRLRAEQSERAEQQFLANMSHEIRTPMNAVMGLTKLLLQKNPREDQLRYLNNIRQSSDALLVILNDILDISKIQAGRLELEFTDLLLSEILDNVRTTLQYRAEEKGLHLNIEADPGIPPVLVGDPVRLQQILINLAGNAVKFTEKGQVILRVQLQGTSGSRCRLYFEVEDTGIGMTPEQLTVVFDSFRQASGDTTRKYGGTGLGLSISKQLVERFGGRLDVHSTPGQGSSFFFTIELETGGQRRAATTNALSPEALEALRGLRILLAEDNELNRVVAVETLQLLIPDVQVRCAENGQEALDLYRSETFDVVLMDVTMPILDGLDATRAIRALPPPQNAVPIIAFTASVTQKEVKNCLASGMNSWVPKPFKDAELIGALSAVRQPGATVLPDIPDNPPPEAPQTSRLQFLEQHTGQNADRIRKYLRLYLDSASQSLPRITEALAAQDREALRRAVHTIKPQFRMIGMPDSAELAQQIENQILEEPPLPNLPVQQVERLLEDIRQSVSEFETYLQGG
ncbi:MAG: response regulator [Saprospiraceae bacterium]|nr:response regulator [Saprospiraceae bacterium]